MSLALVSTVTLAGFSLICAALPLIPVSSVLSCQRWMRNPAPWWQAAVENKHPWGPVIVHRGGLINESLPPAGCGCYHQAFNTPLPPPHRLNQIQFGSPTAAPPLRCGHYRHSCGRSFQRPIPIFTFLCCSLPSREYEPPPGGPAAVLRSEGSRRSEAELSLESLLKSITHPVEPHIRRSWRKTSEAGSCFDVSIIAMTLL